MTDSETLVQRFVQTWHEPDAQARRRAIAEICVYRNARAEFHGREGIEEAVRAAHEAFVINDYVFNVAQVNTNHDAIRYVWEMVPAAGGDAPRSARTSCSSMPTGGWSTTTSSSTSRRPADGWDGPAGPPRVRPARRGGGTSGLPSWPRSRGATHASRRCATRWGSSSNATSSALASPSTSTAAPWSTSRAARATSRGPCRGTATQSRTSGSTTNTITNLAALTLIARGQLDAYSPVAQYWPEFAQQGKEAIEVRPLEVSDTYDWESSTSRPVIAG